MMHASQYANLPKWLSHGENALAMIRMQPDSLPFGRTQGSFLVPDPVGNADAAKVVDLAGSADCDPFVVGQAQSEGCPIRQLGNASRVPDCYGSGSS
jgi:hypothetical protein